jgi:hypothetical protein
VHVVEEPGGFSVVSKNGAHHGEMASFPNPQIQFIGRWLSCVIRYISSIGGATI